MNNESLPLVSIGMPVFNGAKRIADALDSILEQDYSNLEIIISDNSSTDSTPEICKEYTRKDSRIKYYRAERNHGVHWNFNRVFELSRGKYFMLAADDDHREMDIVRQYVEKMEECPDAILCSGHAAQYIEGREELVCVANMDSFNGVTGLVERYEETMRNFPVTAGYGLYRMSGVRKTGMFENIVAGDQAFYKELPLYGEFVQIPHVLFKYIMRREWNTIHQDYFFVYGKKKKPWWYLAFAVLFYNHCKRIMRSKISLGIKLRLWGFLIMWEIRQLVLKILIKVAGFVCPERWKNELGCAIYWRWMHSQNIQVVCEDLYFERIVKPLLGWWR